MSILLIFQIVIGGIAAILVVFFLSKDDTRKYAYAIGAAALIWFFLIANGGHKIFISVPAQI